MANLPAFMNWHQKIKPNTSGYLVNHYIQDHVDIWFTSRIYNQDSRKYIYLTGSKKDSDGIFIIPNLSQAVFDGFKEILKNIIKIIELCMRDIGGYDEWIEHAGYADRQETIDKYQYLLALLPNLNSFDDFSKNYKTEIHFNFWEWDVYSSFSIIIDIENKIFKLIYGDSNDEYVGQGLYIYPTESIYKEVA
jgi:hypothetical protein